jgi:hypothetical protein
MVKKLKLMNLKFVWYLNVSGTVDSLVVRMEISLAKWVLGEYLEQEKEKQNVTLRGLCVDSRLC